MNYTNITEEEYFSLIAKRLSSYMKKNGVKQLDLAKKTNINQSTLSKLMSGESKFTLSHIFRICNALSLEPEVLLAFDHEITPDTLHRTDTGLINKSYINEQILIRDPNHIAFRGYINHNFFIYLYSTISSESSLLKGTITFKDTEYHNYCKATMLLYTGITDSEGKEVKKTYHGELIISLTMGTCYCILINPEIGELCTINFKHIFLFNQKLICRVGTVISTSSGTNKLPIMQRILISEKELNVNKDTRNIKNIDYEFVRGQLKLNDSNIILSESNYIEAQKIMNNSKGELQYFLKECLESETVSTRNSTSVMKFLKYGTYYVFDEANLRSIDVSLDIKAQGISILRNLSISPKYNKISTKTEEFAFQYINSKNSYSPS